MSTKVLAATLLGSAAALLSALVVAVPAPPAAPAEGERWLVGDLHVHTSPPDAAGHSALTVGTAIQAARRARLDFVVLTPHRADRALPVAAASRRELGQALVRRLADEHLASEQPADGPGGEDANRAILVVSGWEYTRETPGHAGISFVDVEALLETAGDETLRTAHELGGVVVVNHPFFRPVASELKIMERVDADRSWRPFLAENSGAGPGGWNAIEVWHDRSVWVEKIHTRMADRYPATQMVRSALRAWDRATLEGGRRITAVGGSDAHGRLPYTVKPMRVVSVRVVDDEDGAGPAEALRRGLRRAAVTFGRDGGAAARDFTARADVDDAVARIGDAIRVEKRARLSWKGPADLYENGRHIGTFTDGAVRELDPPGRFVFWRIEKPGDAFSNMIYANLPPRSR